MMHFATKRNKERMKVTTIALFDWDDTLFPTTPCIADGLIGSNGLRDWKGHYFVAKNVDVSTYTEIGYRAYNILSNHIKVYGASNVFIITNGGRDWPRISLRHLSCLLYEENEKQNNVYLDILNLLNRTKITVESAQFLFGWKYPKDSNLWKLLAFKAVVAGKMKSIYNKMRMTNNKNGEYVKFITFGDRMTDHQSLSECIENKAFQKELKEKNVSVQHKKYTFKQQPSLKEHYQRIFELSLEIPTVEYLTMTFIKNQNQNNCYFTKHF